MLDLLAALGTGGVLAAALRHPPEARRAHPGSHDVTAVVHLLGACR
ncbi:hypothetical protein EV189_2925 [Motilibacter rhizosphaerae]|uniref:Uncharacterized protein n=1 Tax=Motilibacter rhizosphaerae TaxID=598652 RepID=A0A4Q7NQ83_9ACTN|nr:hypothetical protein [Motilibacter rhizosphaerae]RZS87494.1 hypothetical protein EV189_2925 [Motilibacter rhizosphaerae]